MLKSISLALLLIIPAIGFADTINVPLDYSTIQEAIDAAVTGDTVLVSPGTYMENIDFLGKAVVVQSSDGAEFTVIDGGNTKSVVTFENQEGTDSVLDGFTLVNGSGNYFDDWHYGGGVYCYESSPTITNNTIINNTVDFSGGGISCNFSSSPVITFNVINDNWAGSHGGGIYCDNSSAPLIDHNTISDNYAGFGIPNPHLFNYSGAGIYSHASSPEITHNTVANNTGAAHGGGILCGMVSSPTNTRIAFNKVTGNTAEKGAGIYFCHKASPLVEYNVICQNNAVNPGYGGGIGCRDEVGLSEIRNNIIFENSACCGGGIFCDHTWIPIVNNIVYFNAADMGAGMFCQNSAPAIFNNTIFRNSARESGGGIAVRWNYCPQISNTIIWENVATYGPAIWIGDFSQPGSADISFCDIEGGQTSVYVVPGSSIEWGFGMIDEDPLFVDANLGDLHLTYSSPARDSGDNAVVVTQSDVEGDPRVANTRADMGADEYYNHLYVTGDKTPGGLIKTHLVGVPGTAPVALLVGSGILDPPLPTAWGDLFLKAPRVFIPLDPIPSDGIGMFYTTIPLSPPAPFDLPLQALIGLHSNSLTNLEVVEVRVR